MTTCTAVPTHIARRITARRITLDQALAIGEALAAEKRRRPHGEFLPWLRAARPNGLSRRTAQRYLALHLRRDDIAAAGCATLRQAYALLDATGWTRTPARDQAA